MIGAPWTLEVTNHTKGWTHSTYGGKQDTPNLSPADPIVIQQPFKGSWGWSDYPSGWLPRTVQLELRAYSAAAFEADAPCDPGDLIDAHLFHAYVPASGPGAGVERHNSWFRCVGFLDEPEAAQDDRGLVVKLSAADPLARLAEVAVDDPNPWPAESLGARLQRIADAARINLVTRHAFDNLATMGPVTVNNKGALPLLQECLAGAQTAVGGKQLVLRGTVGDLEHTTLFDQTDFDSYIVGDPPAFELDSGGFSHGVVKQAYVIDLVGRDSTMTAPYILTAARDLGAPGAPVGAGLYVTTRTPRGDLWAASSGGAALPASDVLREGTAWVKSRAQAINQVKLVGVDAAGEEKSVLAQYADLVRADGPSTRVVQTQRLIDAGAAAVAVGLLPDRATAVPDWTADQFTLTTRDMSADELSAYSRELFPGDPGLSGMQIPLAIVGVDDLAALTGDDLSGILEGATVQIAKRGQLEIVGQLRSEVLRASGLGTNLVSYADLRAEQVDNMPGITWASFGYHSDDAVPYQGSDRTFDASQAHPSFGHRNLSYRDYRLIGVS